MNTKTKLIILSSSLLAIFIFASPYLSVYSLRFAVEHKNGSMALDYMDLEKITSSVKSQMMRKEIAVMIYKRIKYTEQGDT